MKKVVFVSTVFPFPTDDGKKLVVSGILKYLIERYGAGQVTYILLGSEAEDLSIKNFPCRCFALGQPRVLYRLRNILWLALIKRAKSIQELILYSPKLGRALHNIVADIGPDLVICDTF